MKKIVIMSSMGIGDIITLIPLLRKLKKIFPDCCISIFTFRKNDYLLTQFDLQMWVDEVVDLKSGFNILKILVKKDIMIWPGYYPEKYNILRTLAHCIIVLSFNASQKLVWGDLNKPEFFGLNMVEIKLNILKKIGIKILREDYGLEIPFSYKGVDKSFSGRFRKDKRKKWVTIHIGGKEEYETRLWENSKWKRVINYVYKSYRPLIFLIGGHEDSIIVESLKGSLESTIINLVGKTTLKETSALIDKSDLFISTNSGPMWIAAALGKKQITICGSSKPAWYPYNKRAVVIKRTIDRMHCNPPCDLKKCVYLDRLCMSEISSQTVIKEIERNLNDAE